MLPHKHLFYGIIFSLILFFILPQIGIIGITLGGIGAYVFAKTSGWPELISPAAVAIALLFSAAVGVFFGLYPAFKASRLQPIEALRYESAQAYPIALHF